MYPNTVATKRPPSGSEPIPRRYQKLQSLFYQINNFDKSPVRPHPWAKAHEDKRHGTTTRPGAGPHQFAIRPEASPHGEDSEPRKQPYFPKSASRKFAKMLPAKVEKTTRRQTEHFSYAVILHVGASRNPFAGFYPEANGTLFSNLQPAFSENFHPQGAQPERKMSAARKAPAAAGRGSGACREKRADNSSTRKVHPRAGISFALPDPRPKRAAHWGSRNNQLLDHLWSCERQFFLVAIPNDCVDEMRKDGVYDVVWSETLLERSKITAAALS